MTLLPFQPHDEVRYGDQVGVVIEVRGDRVVIVTDDEVVRILREPEFRALQRVKPS